MIKLVFSNINLHIGDETIHFNSGTPQGSLISPILFDLYINDLLLDLEKDPRVITIKAFADDIMTVSFGKTDTLRITEKFLEWSKLNDMEINTKKSQIIQILKSKSSHHRSHLT